MPHMQTTDTRGEPVQRLGFAVTPIARSTRLAWRGGALEWRRPAAVEVRDGADVRRVPIRNATRWAIVTIAVAGLVTSTIAGWAVRFSLKGRTR